jgi:hypothetical protein
METPKKDHTDPKIKTIKAITATHEKETQILMIIVIKLQVEEIS